MTAAQPVRLRFVRLRPGARAPQRATPGASGYDLYACIGDPRGMTIGPDPVLVPTGIALEAPAGFDVQIRPRSGLSARGVLCVLGTLDADYRGELFATLYCVGAREPYVVHHGDRVAQLVVARLAAVEWQEVEALQPSERGTGGHGSTGR